MVTIVDPSRIDRQNLQTAPRTILEPNFQAIREDILTLAAAINAIVPGAVNPEDLNINGSVFSGLLAGAPASLDLQEAFELIDTKNQANDFKVDKSNFTGAFAGFQGTTQQEFDQYCDGNLAPRIVTVPSVTGFSVNFALIQPNGFNLFDDLADSARTFNLDTVLPGDFTEFRMLANGVTLATFTTLAASARAVLIPNIVGAPALWDAAVAAGGIDSFGRTIINLEMHGDRPAAADLVSNPISMRIGIAQQPEIVYAALNAASDGSTLDISQFGPQNVTMDPATFEYRLGPIPSNVDPLYVHFLIPATFTTVDFVSVFGALGTNPSNDTFPNYSTPGTRQVNGETYNVYTRGPLVPNVEKIYRVTVAT